MKLRPNLIVGVTGVIVLLILLSLSQEMNQRWQIQREIQRLELASKDLQNNVVDLQNLNQYFRTDDYQERQAREKLNYRAPGEQVVLIPEGNNAPPATNELAEKPSAQNYSTPMKWWRIFFVDEPLTAN